MRGAAARATSVPAKRPRASLGAESFSTTSATWLNVLPGTSEVLPGVLPAAAAALPESCPRPRQPLPARSRTLRVRAGAGIVVTLPDETNELCARRSFMLLCHSRGLHRTFIR